ncbi:hypothetical protein BGW80DRAFT_1322167 [Lactifluus volemus]|nr:hypothetical protein BGW80DRAFT_1322167 [Lactifluus volemus]
MSQAAHEALDIHGVPGERIDTSGNRHAAHLVHAQPLQEHYHVSDGSGPLFTMYVKMAEEEDNKMTERWQKDADGVLIFTGLFSAALAVLVAVSIQDLRPSSQNVFSFYLGNIYQLLADPNISRASILATPVQPPPFTPPKYAIWVNSLWFLSLAINLTCALLATSLQQWARRHLTITQLPRYSPHKRARIRALFSDGVDKLYVPWAVEALPTLKHLSLFLFFSGLLIYLFNIDPIVFNVVVWWVGLSAGVYVCITFMPIFRHDSPYYAPLSSPVWYLYTGILYAFFQILWFLRRRLVRVFSTQTLVSFDVWRRTYRERLVRGIVKTAQDSASKLSGEIDGNVLKWTFDALEEDHELQHFFDGIPGFCDSKVVDDPRASLATLGEFTLGDALSRFLERTWASNSETIKERRVMTCVKAADTGHLPYAANGVLRGIFERGVDGVLRSVKLGHSLRSQLNHDHIERGSSLCAQGIVAGIIANVHEHDHRWKMLVKDQFGISEATLRDYLIHGDSVLLANLIHITRQFLPSYLGGDAWMASALLYILPSVSKFNIKNALPALQHDFCALWNEIALEAGKSGSYRIPISILRNIRHHYIALHEGTDAAPTEFSASTQDRDSVLFRSSSYPSCNITSHHIYVPHPEATLTATTPSSRRHPSSLPALTTNHNHLHHSILPATPITDSSRLAPPADVRKHRRPSFSPYPTTPVATQGTADCLGPTISSSGNSKPDFDPRPTRAASTSTPQPPFPPRSIRTVPSQHNADLSVVLSSVIPGVSSSSLSIPVPTNSLPADLQSTVDSSGAPRTGKLAPGRGLGALPSTSAATSSLSSNHTSILRLDIATNGAAPNTDETSLASDVPNNMEAPHHGHPASGGR